MYTENDILFPFHAIPHLKNSRGKEWAKFIERLTKLPENNEEVLAFMMMVVRINGCMNCETDSFRAMRGCVACAQQSIKRFKGDDDELLEMFDRALQDVRKFKANNPNWTISE